jgi:hypothetical protein
MLHVKRTSLDGGRDPGNAVVSLLGSPTAFFFPPTEHTYAFRISDRLVGLVQYPGSSSLTGFLGAQLGSLRPMARIGNT